MSRTENTELRHAKAADSYTWAARNSDTASQRIPGDTAQGTNHTDAAPLAVVIRTDTESADENGPTTTTPAASHLNLPTDGAAQADTNFSEAQGIARTDRSPAPTGQTVRGTTRSTMHGDGGPNFIFGSDDNDGLLGTNNVDFMWGADGDDIISGYGGDDFLFGVDGNDVLFGGDGNDHLIGGDGHNILIGGAGTDTFVLSSGDGNHAEIRDFEIGTDKLGADSESLHTSMDTSEGVLLSFFDGSSALLHDITVSQFDQNFAEIWT